MAEWSVRPARPEDTGAAFEIFAGWQKASYGEVEIGPEMFATTLAGDGVDSAAGGGVGAGARELD